MSSATLTESRRTGDEPVDRPVVLRPWHFFVLTSLAIALAGGVLLRHLDPAELVLAVVTVLSAGFGAAALYRTLQPLAARVEVEAPVLAEGRTRMALERDKVLTLRSIKELEFDHAMGKVSDGDFAEMRNRLRARALRLIQQLEGTTVYRERIEKDLESRLRASVGQGFSPAASSPEAMASSPEGLPHVRGAHVRGAGATCAKCGTESDIDARFCKMCGHALVQ
jgi:hypothetical protein